MVQIPKTSYEQRRGADDGEMWESNTSVGVGDNRVDTCKRVIMSVGPATKSPTSCDTNQRGGTKQRRRWGDPDAGEMGEVRRGQQHRARGRQMEKEGRVGMPEVWRRWKGVPTKTTTRADGSGIVRG